MNTTPLVIEAVVDDAERATLEATAEQLGECLKAATGALWPVEVRFHPTIEAIVPPNRPTIVIASLLPDVLRTDESLAQIEARWRKGLAALTGEFLGVFVCTVFRCVAPTAQRRRAESTPDIAERIRRVNLLAAELSHDSGVGVIDIDRVFTHIGARELGTDYRQTGAMAADVAAHAIVSGVIAIALDDVIPPDAQHRAKRFHGDLAKLATFVLSSRRREAGS
ncbi:MAG: hypothetical protein ABI724_08035 [Betaproteobacteria bacterium]